MFGRCTFNRYGGHRADEQDVPARAKPTQLASIRNQKCFRHSDSELRGHNLLDLSETKRFRLYLQRQARRDKDAAAIHAGESNCPSLTKVGPSFSKSAGQLVGLGNFLGLTRSPRSAFPRPGFYQWNARISAQPLLSSDSYSPPAWNGCRVLISTRLPVCRIKSNRLVSLRSRRL